MTLENQSYGAVRIESTRFGKPGVLITGLAFFGSFVLLCLLGHLGPDVFKSETAERHLRINMEEYSAFWTGELANVVPENQLIWCTTRISRPASIPLSESFSYMQPLVINVKGSDEKFELGVAKNALWIEENFHAAREVRFRENEQWSNELTVLNMHTVPYKNYRIEVEYVTLGDLMSIEGFHKVEGVMDVSFTLTFINSAYTVFEMKWKYFFLFTTILAMFFPCLNRGGSCSSSTCFVSFSMIFEGFFTKLSTIPRKQWSYQQRWVAVLLIGLFFFNDPLFRWSIYANTSRTAELLSGVYISWMGAFLCLLMLFWLCALDETCQPTSPNTEKFCGSASCGRHCSKIAFMFIYWVFFTSLFISVRFFQDENPSWAEARSDRKFTGIVICSASLVSIYLLWFIWYLCKALKEIRRMPPPFLFVFLVTFFTFVSTCVAMYMGSMYIIPSAPIAFLGMTGLYNLYVWTMAFIYAPLTSAGSNYNDFEVEIDAGVEGDDGVNVGTLANRSIGDMQL